MTKVTFVKTRVLGLAVVLATSIGLASSVSATAAPIPPGYSAVDQYTEAYPGAGGDNKPPAGNGQEGGSNLPGKTVDRFEQAGPSGAAALALAVATAPSNGTRDNEQTPGAGDRTAGTDLGAKASPVNGNLEIGKQVFGEAGSDGMGLFLPAILVLAAALAISYVVRRKRILM